MKKGKLIKLTYSILLAVIFITTGCGERPTAASDDDNNSSSGDNSSANSSTAVSSTSSTAAGSSSSTGSASFVYNFDSGTESFSVQYMEGSASGSVSQTTSETHDGSGSMQIDCTYSGATMNGLDVSVSDTIDVSGKTVSLWIYAPAGLSGNNGVQIHFKSGDPVSPDSAYSPWLTVGPGMELEPGQWNEIQVNPSAKTTSPDSGQSWYFNPDEGSMDYANVVQFGISVRSDGVITGDYTYYVDSIDF
ncbi:MAG TPA: hypothetical protein VKS21_00600 [Spirochaetota bacterium]|nr:hypothetical protein [Spirochaetota bacterium]